MPFKVLPPVIASLLLVGCAGMSSPPPHESAPPPPRVEASGECGAARVQDRVGRDYSEALGQSIRDESGAAAMRVIRPGAAVTVQYRPARHTVRLADDDVTRESGRG